MKKSLSSYLVLVCLFGLIIAGPALASSQAGEESVHLATTFLWIAVLLIAAKISSLVEMAGQPSVLGELIIGLIIGNLVIIGLHWFEPIKSNEIIKFFAELGVVILLFQIGLESNIKQMKKVGGPAFLVAVVGVVVPFVLGTYIVGPWLLPGLSSNTYLFLGATLTATSVGITARVFRDLNKLQTKEAQIVLGAAVIDDVLGLIILAIVSAVVTLGAVSLGSISLVMAKAIIFLIGAILIGQIVAPALSRIFSAIHTGVGMKFTIAVCFGLVFAYLADLAGLAPIVGAFAAGLVLDPVHFRYFKDPKVVSDVKQAMQSQAIAIKDKVYGVMEKHADRHIEDLIETISYFFVPIFFVYTGMMVKLETLFDLPVFLTALGISLVAVIGKYSAGFVAGNVNRNIVGFGMVPRGEVGLIFASIGHRLGAVNDKIFSVIVIVVIITTLITPPILSQLIKRQNGGADEITEKAI